MKKPVRVLIALACSLGLVLSCDLSVEDASLKTISLMQQRVQTIVGSKRGFVTESLDDAELGVESLEPVVPVVPVGHRVRKSHFYEVIWTQ
mmetsp:Transcript_50291/g.133522  ORF Transcript_50291/g.133522 Transcript_50291/m.133522 type:complete len:91 (+) Transcript_50291:72-344(+)|eukprot:CAMPEP_0194504226 /NCGR_PEP_ID=MMETSP0253-20130528/28828_1 /TAXON_ID=2966 /ORGANISM="Noctiluca scintillans" /LENGTH=90 /DNA_ID=CAMNT_0039346597 /DNA_START=17 /DNA_END=289 /DNA_ORIENTATION=-